MPRRSRAAFQAADVLQREEGGIGLLDLERRADVDDDLPPQDLAPRDRDDRLDHVGLRPLEEHHSHLAVEARRRPRFPGVDRPHHILRGIAQAHVREPERLVGHPGPAAVEDDLAGRLHLVSAQGGKGVQRRRGGDGGGRHDAMVGGGRPVVASRLPSPPCMMRPNWQPGAPASWLVASRPTTTTCWWCWAAASRERPRSSGRERTPCRSTRCPSFPPYTATGHRALGLVSADGRAPGAGVRRPLSPLRGDRAGRGRAPAPHGYRRRLHHGHPHHGGRRHPGRPHHRLHRGGRGPPQPHRAAVPSAARPSSTWWTPTTRACASSRSPRRTPPGRCSPADRASTPRWRARNSRHRPRSGCYERLARTWSACPWRSRPSPRRHGGARVLGLALVTNAAAADSAPLPELAAISTVGAAAAPAVAAIVRHVVGSGS